MNKKKTYMARAIEKDGALLDIAVEVNGREVHMLGPSGKARELAIIPDGEALFADFEANAPLVVLIGSGTGAALEAIHIFLEKRFGSDFCLAIIDKEDAVLNAGCVEERYASLNNIVWIKDENPDAAIRRLTSLQNEYGGRPLLPFLNPFYLRLDREYYKRIMRACEASKQANFWSKAHYPKFQNEKARVLLLTSQYFLIGEIIAACERLALPYRLLQLPEGEVGQNEFVEDLLTAVLEFKPDFLFTINHLGVDREGVLTDLLSRLEIPLASWFVDNPHLILYLYSNLVSPWTSIFTWDADNIVSLNDLGFSHVSYLPLGVDATRFKPPQDSGKPLLTGLPRDWNRQVSFVGNSMVHKVSKRLERSNIPPPLVKAYPELAAGFADSSERSVRAFLQKNCPAFLEIFDSMPSDEDRLNYETLLTWEATLRYRLSCINAILPFQPLIAGDDGWKEVLPRVKNGWHYHPELGYYDYLPSFYPCARINFNCTSKQMKGAVNQRVFDVPATGSFLLTDYRQQVENLFEPGKEIICYHSPEEARYLAEKYLAAPEERRKVAENARKRILAEHRYEHRMLALVSEMKKRYA